MFEPIESFALTVVALFVKIWGVAIFQGIYRARSDQFTRREDAEVFGDGEVAETDPLPVDRAQRALRNDVENIPVFLFLAWSFVTLDVWPAATPYYFSVFVVARTGHSISYILGTQPARTISYTLGLAVSIALSWHLVSAIVLG